MSDEPSTAQRYATPSGPPGNSAWVTGGIALAGILMLVNGVLYVFQGISAIAEDDVYARLDSYIYRISLTGWGWILLVLGLIAVAIGCGILGGRTWARVTGIALAALGLVAQFLFLPYAPVWSFVLMALHVFVIWALAAYRPDRAR
ncbi:hypothetical protein [Streptomyces sp. NPDC058812]|uniref:DUF7144 family membrane protein n=1 Tax=unclassified Streptomyces TaxID=2593676 RepID=UPI0036CD6244